MMIDFPFIKNYLRRDLHISKGCGSFLYCGNKKYLDFLSGVVFNNLGYNHEGISCQSIKQIKKIIHASNYYYTTPQIRMARKLLKMSRLSEVFFANSGAEANEAALKFLSLKIFQLKII